MVLALALAAAWLPGLLGTGCGRTHEGFESGGSAGSAGSESADDGVYLDLARAQCAYLERCDPDALHRFSKSSTAACVDYFRCLLDSALSGKTFRDGDTLPSTCIDSLLSRSCPDTEMEPIDRFSYGTFPWGPACGQPTLEQLLAPPPDAPEEGQACIRYGEREACADGGYCELEDVPRFGVLRCGVCQAGVPLGEPCDESGQCTEGSVCALGECQPPRLPGDPCNDSEQCRFGNCEAGVCGLSAYAPTPYADNLGQACDDSRDCGNQAALACADQRCQALSDLGESCATVPCRLGLTCVADECQDLGCTVDVGEPCQTYCTSSLCIGGICEPPPDREGQTCTRGCGNGLVCSEGRCEKPPPSTEGAGCDFDGDCDTGFCDRDLSEFCSGGSCIIPSCDRCGTCAELPKPSDCE